MNNSYSFLSPLYRLEPFIHFWYGCIGTVRLNLVEVGRATLQQVTSI